MDTTNQDMPEAIYFAKPSLLKRLKATFLDVTVIIFLIFLASYTLIESEGISTELRTAVFTVICLYEPIFTAFSVTLGQHMMGIRVVGFQAKIGSGENKRITFPQALFRWILKIWLGWISLLTVTGHSFGRAIHDMASGSLIVEV